MAGVPGAGPFVDTGLTPSTAYYYEVKAVNSAGESGYSSEATATTQALPVVVPGVPTNIGATAQSSTSISVSWIAVAGATSYKVFRSATSGGTCVQVGATASSSFVDTGLTPSTAYYYKVKAANSIGESDYSSEVTTTTQASPVQAPPTPTGVSGTAGDGKATISWNNITGASSYNIYYAVGATVTTSGTKVSGVTSPYSQSGLTNGAQYAFAVTAVNSAGESNLSAVQTVTPVPAAPPAPNITSANAVNTSVTISWGAVSGATSYNLYYQAGTSVVKTVATKVSGAVSPQAVTGLTNGTQYAFAVTAVNAGGESGLSPVLTATPSITGTVTDIDGNVYHYVTIGTQTWMVENLKTSRQNDGTSIPLVTGNATWAALATPAFCWYNNDPVGYGNTYGALYNWYAVSTGRLAPVGWHIASDSEWSVLTTFLGGGNIAGGALKETGTAHWLAPNTGGKNAVGFSALPGGYRSDDGAFNSIGIGGAWWSSTASWTRSMSLCTISVMRYSYPLGYGLSVRCVKDN
jgi:uncharacterized protein (TIGR02145 family)